MTKTVFGSHSQTAHVWAQNTYPHGRASDGRMYFESRILFSYGSHFALGLIIPDHDGTPTATLLNSSSYSISTSKHKGHAWQAARGHIVMVPALTAIAQALYRATGPGKVKADIKRQRPEVERHIVEWWKGYKPESAAFVLGLVGGTEKQANALLEKGRRADEKREREAAKSQLASDLRHVAAFAAMSDSDFRAHWRGQIGAYEYNAGDKAESLTKRLRQLHKIASAQGKAKAKARLWALVKLSGALAESAYNAAAVASKNQSLTGAIVIVRQYIANCGAADPAPYDSRQWSDLARAAERVALAVLYRPSLAALHNVANETARLASDAREAAREAERAASIAAREKAEREKAERVAANRAAWFAGDPEAHSTGEKDDKGGAFLRAVHVERDDSGAVTGGELQTSRGASVPLTHALRAFRFIKLVRAKGEGWKANGKTVPVGHFRIDQIGPNGDFEAGCHFIQWAEVERLAGALGVMDLTPDESAVVTREHA